MSDTERVYSLYVQANPVPDPNLLPASPEEAELLITERSRDMATQQLTETRRSRQPAQWRIAAYAFATVVLFATVIGAAFLITGGRTDVAQVDELGVATEIVDDLVAAVDAGDVDTYVGMYTEDGTYTDPSPSASMIIRGRDAIAREASQTMLATRNLVRTGDLVAVAENSYIFPAQFDVFEEGVYQDTYVGEAQITLDGNLVSAFEWISWTVQE